MLTWASTVKNNLRASTQLGLRAESKKDLAKALSHYQTAANALRTPDPEAQAHYGRLLLDSAFANQLAPNYQKFNRQYYGDGNVPPTCSLEQIIAFYEFLAPMGQQRHQDLLTYAKHQQKQAYLVQ